MSLADRQKWDARYAVADNVPREPSEVLLSLAHFLPSRGRALEVAGGGGRHAIWLAQRGLDVKLIDISPIGLALARRRAAEAGLAIDTVEIDLEQQPPPAGPFDLILIAYYYCPTLVPRFHKHLAPGGLLVVIQPTRQNLERHDKPPAGFLYEPGELRRLAVGLEIEHYAEGWLADERHDAVLVARRRAAASPATDADRH